jgi:hypothetical protein
MATIMLSCPETGQPFSVGLDTDPASFRALPSVEVMVRCPHCGNQHPWSKSTAWLAMPPLARAAADTLPRQ